MRTGLLVGILLCWQVSAAQPTSWRHLPDTLQHDMRHILTVSGKIIAAPFHWNAQQWTAVGQTAFLTALVSAGDEQFKQLALSHRSPFLDQIFSLDNYHGSKTSGVLGVTAYTAGLLFNNPTLRRTGLQAIEAFYLSGTLNLLLKIVAGRRRPYAAQSAYDFRPFRGTTEYRSLPSGHVVTAVAVSTVFARAFRNSLWRVFWYGSAAIVAGARVYHNAHWVSDLIPAAVLGYAVGDYITRFSVPTHRQLNQSHSAVQWFWQIAPGNVQLRLVF